MKRTRETEIQPTIEYHYSKYIDAYGLHNTKYRFIRRMLRNCNSRIHAYAPLCHNIPFRPVQMTVRERI